MGLYTEVDVALAPAVVESSDGECFESVLGAVPGAITADMPMVGVEVADEGGEGEDEESELPDLVM